jgi:hypothetical protein
VIFEKRLPHRMRSDITKLLKARIDEVKAVVGAFMPIQFITLMDHQK